MHTAFFAMCITNSLSLFLILTPTNVLLYSPLGLTIGSLPLHLFVYLFYTFAHFPKAPPLPMETLKILNQRNAKTSMN